MPRSPWRRIPLVTIAGELAARRARLGRSRLRRLDTSNGCQDHTVLPSAATRQPDVDEPCADPPKPWQADLLPVVYATVDAHGLNRPATTDARPTQPRPPHPPRVRDDRDPPLHGMEWFR